MPDHRHHFPNSTWDSVADDDISVSLRDDKKSGNGMAQIGEKPSSPPRLFIALLLLYLVRSLSRE